MRHLGLVCCLALFTGSGALAADIKGRVVMRDPAKPFVALKNFQVRITQPGRAAPLYVSQGQNLTPEPGAKFVNFTISIDLLPLGDKTDVVMTFTADGRVPARLQLAGNQDQTLALVLPIEPPPATAVEVVSYPCPPIYYVSYCPPVRHRLFRCCCR
jgi:hypothetical protein